MSTNQLGFISYRRVKNVQLPGNLHEPFAAMDVGMFFWGLDPEPVVVFTCSEEPLFLLFFGL